MKKLLILNFLACVSCENQSTQDKELAVKDLRVIDGDTVEVLPKNSGQSERVRLLGIDAPEKKQAFGKESKDLLERCVANHQIVVFYEKKDRYGRLLGKVMADGYDCNYNQVLYGMAWHYKKYQKNQTDYERKYYALAEKKAQELKYGLWSQRNPVKPSKYRKLNK